MKGHGSILGQGTKIPQGTTKTQRSQKKKKEIKNFLETWDAIRISGDTELPFLNTLLAEKHHQHFVITIF